MLQGARGLLFRLGVGLKSLRHGTRNRGSVALGLEVRAPTFTALVVEMSVDQSEEQQGARVGPPPFAASPSARPPLASAGAVPASAAGKTVLLCPKKPKWTCSHCNTGSQWASRLACRACGAWAPYELQQKAYHRHAQAEAKRGAAGQPSDQQNRSSQPTKPHPNTQCEQALEDFRSMGLDLHAPSVLEENLESKLQKELITRPLHERTQELRNQIGTRVSACDETFFVVASHFPRMNGVPSQTDTNGQNTHARARIKLLHLLSSDEKQVPTYGRLNPWSSLAHLGALSLRRRHWPGQALSEVSVWGSFTER